MRFFRALAIAALLSPTQLRAQVYTSVIPGTKTGGSSNMHVMGHIPLDANGHTADITIEQELSRFPIDENTYVVIVTRGHQRDGVALGAVIDSPARYVGLIGSKRKVKAIYDDLAQRGVPVEKLLRVHAPIGYEIGAVTVPEIAVSIAAELVAVRRGFENKDARPMKIDEQQIRAWLARPSAAPAAP